MSGPPPSTPPVPSTAEREAAAFLVPIWAWAVAADCLLAGVVVLVVGRGGTAVLLGAGLAFLALTTLLLSVPDDDPAADS